MLTPQCQDLLGLLDLKEQLDLPEPILQCQAQQDLPDRLDLLVQQDHKDLLARLEPILQYQVQQDLPEHLVL